MEAAPPPAPPPASPEPRADRVRVGDVISETFSIYGSHVAALIGTALAVFVVVGVITALLAMTGSFFLLMLGVVVYLLGHILYTGFVVKLVQDTRDGKRDFSVMELLRAAAPAVGALLLNGIIFAFAVSIGFILLIVPGLILLTIWAVTAPSIVVERRGAIEAFGRSRELVRGEGWSVFGTIVVVFLIAIGISIVTGALGAATGDAGRIVFDIIGNLVAAPIAALAVSVIFFNLGGGEGAATRPTATPPGAPAA